MKYAHCARLLRYTWITLNLTIKILMKKPYCRNKKFILSTFQGLNHKSICLSLGVHHPVFPRTKINIITVSLILYDKQPHEITLFILKKYMYWTETKLKIYQDN
jgi:hypothetical protein